MPRANLRNLMLRADVVAAVHAGKFHIYAVSTIDEGIEVLTGIPAGERKRDGGYPADSVNERVQKKLLHYAEQQRRLAAMDNHPGAARTEIDG
jgi:predicted ATP-dependent protease